VSALAGLSVVLVRFEDEGNIERAVRSAAGAAAEASDEYEVIVVADGSRDETLPLASELARRDPHVRLLVHAGPRGYGAAVSTGIGAARMPWILLTDAGLPIDPHELQRFLPVASHADLVVGRRAARDEPLPRRIGAGARNLLLRYAFRLPVHDADCAFKLVRRDLVAGLRLSWGGAMTGTELLVRARAARERVREVEVGSAPRGAATAAAAAGPATTRRTAAAGALALRTMCAEVVLDMLVVDDEPDLRRALADAFVGDGHRVTAVADGSSAIDRASTDRFDVVLLDVALGPGPDGFEVCRTLRRRGDLVPIIMLTARDSEAEAVLGLESGADDYVTKPFGVTELRSRIRAVLRRASPRSFGAEVLQAGPVVLDRRSREVTVDGHPVALTFSEYEVLQALMNEPDRLLNRQELLRAIWGDSAYRDPRGIDVHVRHLREKLEAEPERPRLILTHRGVGYRLHLP
jgi:DNA-binding response OmpR family regulator